MKPFVGEMRIHIHMYICMYVYVFVYANLETITCACDNPGLRELYIDRYDVCGPV